MTEPENASKSHSAMPTHPGRLRLLVLAHLLISPAPAVAFLAPADIRYLPVIWLGSSVLLAQLMLLAVWLGLGRCELHWRLIATALGCAWLTTWACLPQIATQATAERWHLLFGMSLGSVAVWAGVFFAVRRFKADLQIATPGRQVPVETRWQFSILHLLIVTAVVAIVLGLAQGAEAGRQDSEGWGNLVASALMIVTFLINLYCAVWATLGEARIGWRLGLVVLVAVLLGVAISLPSGIQLLGWWLFAAMVVVMTAPTLIVAASLLVVRSCGYRLVPSGGDTRARRRAIQVSAE